MSDLYIIVNRYNTVLFNTTDYRNAKGEFDKYKLPGYCLYKIPGEQCILLKMV